MDIMDSSDTPEGGMNQQTTSTTTSPPVQNQRELPLSVDEDDQREPLPNQHHSSSSSSSSRLSANEDREVNAYPTSQDDVMMTTAHTSSLSSRVSDGLSTLKEKMKEGVDSMENKLEQGKEAAEKEWNKHSQQRSASSSTYTAPSNRSTIYHDTDRSNPTGSTEMNSGNMTGAPSRDKESLVHPLASNMRDPHLHPGAVSLPTHANEHSSVSPVNTHYVSDARARGLEAANNLEPKDESAHSVGSGSITDTIHSLGDKVDQGINTLREKVNSWGTTQGSTSTQSTQASPSSSHVAKNDGVATVETHTENSVEPKPAPYSLIDKTNTANIDIINRRQNQNNPRTE